MPDGYDHPLLSVYEAYVVLRAPGLLQSLIPHERSNHQQTLLDNWDETHVFVGKLQARYSLNLLDFGAPAKVGALPHALSGKMDGFLATARGRGGP